jgi:protein-S-isoprenylcysteine O-methyltransferase Ste14
MKPRFLAKLIGSVLYVTACCGVPLFLPIWTLAWPRAWIFLGLVVAMATTLMFSIFPTRPDLLDERYKPPIQRGQPLQDRLLTLALLASFFGLLVFTALDVFRFHLLGETTIPVATLGLVLFAGGWTVAGLAVRDNAFAAVVVRYQQERHQVVVDRGTYAVVRHPMYAGAIPFMIGMPLWLGSYAGALLALVPVATLVLRVLVEERFLREKLDGYAAYTQKVRWRLVPFIW